MANDIVTDTNTLYGTIVVFGFLSFALYFILSRTGTRQQQQPQRNNGNRIQVQHGLNTGTTTRTDTEPTSIRKVQLVGKSSRVPTHVSAASAKITVRNGTNIISDGIVAFRHTKAFDEQQQVVDESIVVQNRKDRARIFTRLLDDATNGGLTISKPPGKGGTIVVAVPIDDCDCPKLRRILYLLATSYNLFVIIVVTTNEKFVGDERIRTINRLRGLSQPGTTDTNDGTTTTTSEAESSSSSSDQSVQLPETVLPSHRIVGCTTVTGRVAFVRQLERIELMIDYDPEVKTLLSRFGHKVIVISGSSSSTNSSSNNESNPSTDTTQLSHLGSVLL